MNFILVFTIFAFGFWVAVRLYDSHQNRQKRLQQSDKPKRPKNWQTEGNTIHPKWGDAGTQANIDRLLDQMSDPREAAAVLLIYNHLLGGQMSPTEKPVLTTKMQQHFHVAAETAEGLFSFGRMVNAQCADLMPKMPKLLKPLRATLTDAEKKEFIALFDGLNPSQQELRRYLEAQL